MSCLDIPEILGAKPASSAVKRIAEMFPGCKCEGVSICPLLSPGRVEEHETVARFVRDNSRDVDPDTQEVLGSLFEHCGTNGMSVTRMEIAGGRGLADQQARGRFIGFVEAKVADIRRLYEADIRTFAVYDTALPENPHHADVCQVVNNPGALAIKIRRSLLETFTRTPRSTAGS